MKFEGTHFGLFTIVCYLLLSEVTGFLSGLHHHSVNHWIRAYQSGGFESLCQYNYGTNKSELKKHSGSILKSFTERPPA